ncbi:MAG TPA: LysR family transcriptional regulator [Chthoniobacterales bacterium]
MLEVIDSRQLRAFVTMARLGSFTQTARELGLTQSAISHTIRTLEEDLGCQLFYKSAKRVFLTREGQRLQMDAEAILLAMGHARRRILNMDAIDRGELRIGCNTSASQFILPTVLREFKECFPHYIVSVIPEDAPNLIDGLESGTIDIALGVKPDSMEQLAARDLFEDNLLFLVSPMHPWSASGQMNRKELREQHFILYNRHSYTFQMIESYLLSQGLRLQRYIEMNSMEAIKELVKLGLGVAIAPRWGAVRELENGSINAIPMPRPGIRRKWAAMYLKSRPLNLAEETFLGLCAAVTEQLEK